MNKCYVRTVAAKILQSLSSIPCNEFDVYPSFSKSYLHIQRDDLFVFNNQRLDLIRHDVDPIHIRNDLAKFHDQSLCNNCYCHIPMPPAALLGSRLPPRNAEEITRVKTPQMAAGKADIGDTLPRKLTPRTTQFTQEP